MGSSPDPGCLKDALQRILASPQFSASPRASRFLRYVVEAELAGREGELKEYVLAIEVFDRSSSFDPRADTIVRVEAVKLRKRLAAYYRGSGRVDPLMIEMPPGGYRIAVRRRSRNGKRAGGPKRPPTIAVLPFVNLSRDPVEEYWSDGLTEELTSGLARAGSVRVVSRTSARAFKGSSMDIREIGRQLGAELILEGAVRNSGGWLRITAQLVDASTGLHLWADSLDRRVEDAFAVQEEVVRAIGQALRIEVRTEPRTATPVRPRPAAFELYLKAQHAMDRPDFASQREAMDLFQQARAADPTYPLPVLGIARSHMRWAMIGLEVPRKRVAEARAALEQALQLDPRLPEAHALLGLLISRHIWQWEEAGERHRRALELAPYSAEAHHTYASEYLAPLGRFDEAFAENRRARELDCFSRDMALGHAYILLHARRYRESEEGYRRQFAEHPKRTGIRGGVAFALWAQDRFDEAASEFEVVTAADPGGGQGQVFLAAVRALSGDREPAQKLLGALELKNAAGFVRALDFALLHIGLRQPAEAIAALEQAFQNQESGLMWAKVSFLFDSLRGHPRFQALLSKLGFDSP